MNKEPELPGTAKLYESGGYIDGMVNPFESLPFPNVLTIGLSSDDYPNDEAASIMEIRRDGTAAVFDDPLGHPIVTFCPEDIALFEFLVAHFNHYATEWKELPLADRQKCMSSFPRSPGFTDDETVARSERSIEPRPAWWWAGMHSDALHPGDRKDCEHCQQMIVAFGKMPPKEEIVKAYEDNLNIDGPSPTIRDCVLIPPGPPESERQKFDTESGLPVKKGGKETQPKLSKEFLNR